MLFFPTSIPSPSNGVWSLGPIPLRAYALIILVGIFVAIWLGNKRWIERGGLRDQVLDVAMWAVPFGVIGGRLYHVLTDWGTYFGENGRGFLAAFKIWEGGLGIWGAIALGGVGVYIASQRMKLAFAPLADALAPGIVLAQAIGRWGNWFNQELFGRPTTLPWALEIDAVHRPVGYEEFSTFHPTFLYESLACIAIAAILIWADKKFVLGHGRVFALYVALYCAARGAIETLRIDQANYILGIRLNVFTALIIGAGGLIYFILSAERYPGREAVANGKVVRAGSRRAHRIESSESPIEPSVTVATITENSTETNNETVVQNTGLQSENSISQTSQESTSQDSVNSFVTSDSQTENMSKERGRRRKH